MEEWIWVFIPVVGIVSLFVILPALVFNFIAKLRSSKSLTPDDERMLEDLWRSARAMERRIETLEDLIDSEDDDYHTHRPRSSGRRRPPTD